MMRLGKVGFAAILVASFLLVVTEVQAKPVEISEDNWESLLGQGEWMVEL